FDKSDYLLLQLSFQDHLNISSLPLTSPYFLAILRHLENTSFFVPVTDNKFLFIKMYGISFILKLSLESD
ncbi:hypothetical protein ACXWO8_09665, partial [Streptococcus pyogenes]